MLKTAHKISMDLQGEFGPYRVKIKNIVDSFKSLGIFDCIEFKEFKAKNDNPIIGIYSSWSMSPAVYAAPEIYVKIGVSNGLTPDWRRFVVCKELCHSLDGAPKEVNVSSITRLVEEFSLYSHNKDLGDVSTTFAMEKVAECCAVELLCPLELRERELHTEGAGQNGFYRSMATKYGMPINYAEFAFTEDYNDAIGSLLNSDL